MKLKKIRKISLVLPIKISNKQELIHIATNGTLREAWFDLTELGLDQLKTFVIIFCQHLPLYRQVNPLDKCSSLDSYNFIFSVTDETGLHSIQLINGKLRLTNLDQPDHDFGSQLSKSVPIHALMAAINKSIVGLTLPCLEKINLLKIVSFLFSNRRRFPTSILLVSHRPSTQVLSILFSISFIQTLISRHLRQFLSSRVLLRK